MAITLSQKNYWELFEEPEEQKTFSADEFDTIWKYPRQILTWQSKSLQNERQNQ